MLTWKAALAEPRTLVRLAWGLSREDGIPRDQAQAEVCLGHHGGGDHRIPWSPFCSTHDLNLPCHLGPTGLVLKALFGRASPPTRWSSALAMTRNTWWPGREQGRFVPGPLLLKALPGRGAYLGPGAWIPTRAPSRERSGWMRPAQVKRDRHQPAAFSAQPLWAFGEVAERGFRGYLPYPSSSAPPARPHPGVADPKLAAFGGSAGSLHIPTLLISTWAPSPEERSIVFTDSRQTLPEARRAAQDLFRRRSSSGRAAMGPGCATYLSGLAAAKSTASWAQSDPGRRVLPLRFSPERGLSGLLSLMALRQPQHPANPQEPTRSGARIIRYRYRHLEKSQGRRSPREL